MRRHWASSVLGLLVFASYITCTIPRGWEPGTYGGTVVDAETGAPVQGAVVVVMWTKCPAIHMDGCGLLHTIREAVTDASGAFSVDAVPEVDWNPFTYVKYRRPNFLIYAVDYLPVETGDQSVAGPGGNNVDFEHAMRRHPRIPLERPETAKELWKFASPGRLSPEIAYENVPLLTRAVSEQRKRLGLEPLGGRSRSKGIQTR